MKIARVKTANNAYKESNDISVKTSNSVWSKVKYVRERLAGSWVIRWQKNPPRLIYQSTSQMFDDILEFNEKWDSKTAFGTTEWRFMQKDTGNIMSYNYETKNWARAYYKRPFVGGISNYDKVSIGYHDGEGLRKITDNTSYLLGAWPSYLKKGEVYAQCNENGRGIFMFVDKASSKRGLWRNVISPDPSRINTNGTFIGSWPSHYHSMTGVICNEAGDTGYFAIRDDRIARVVLCKILPNGGLLMNVGNFGTLTKQVFEREPIFGTLTDDGALYMWRNDSGTDKATFYYKPPGTENFSIRKVLNIPESYWSLEAVHHMKNGRVLYVIRYINDINEPAHGYYYSDSPFDEPRKFGEASHRGYYKSSVQIEGNKVMMMSSHYNDGDQGYRYRVDMIDMSF